MGLCPVPRVEPTNNSAERALRPAVIWRKTCYGSQREQGCRFVERILTTSANCQVQGRNPLNFVSESLTAHWSGQQAPNALLYLCTHTAKQPIDKSKILTYNENSWYFSQVAV